MLVNLMPYLKDGKVEWKAAQVEAQTFTCEGMVGNNYRCVNDDDPTEVIPWSKADCIFPSVCSCSYCKLPYDCADTDTCMNMDCPEKTHLIDCLCCHKPKLGSLNGAPSCADKLCPCCPDYILPMEGGGGGGGNPPPVERLPNINIMNQLKWQLQEPNECLKECKEYLQRTGLTTTGDRTHVYRLTSQDQTGSHPSYNSLTTITSVIDRHLSEGRGIIVGLDYRSNSSNDDGTDHFVVVTGRFYDSTTGQYYYTYMDPGSQKTGCDTSTNRLYVDQTNNTIHYNRPNDNKGRENTITHIRPNDGNYNGSTTY